MTRAKYENRCYELKGASLAAARELESEIEKQIKIRQPMQSGNMGDIQRDWQVFYREFLVRLKKEKPDLIKSTGLGTPSTILQALIGGKYPRAYHEYPSIFLSPEKNPRYFMYVTKGIDGKDFVPPDAVLLTGKAEQAAGDLLFAGGWLGNAPLVTMPKTGVALDPLDPVVKKSLSSLKRQFNKEPNTKKMFIATGKSLRLVEEFQAREKAYNEAVSALFDHVKKATEALFSAIDAPAGDTYVNMSYGEHNREGDSTGIELSVRSRARGGERVAGVPESPAYHLGPGPHGDQVVVLRRDTPEGRALAARVDALPSRPWIGEVKELHANFDYQLQQFDQMLGVNGVVPQVRKMGVYTLLVYNADKKTRHDFCPPDARPLPAGFFEWMDADEADRRLGDVPPPMPTEIADILKAGPGRQAKTAPKP